MVPEVALRAAAEVEEVVQEVADEAGVEVAVSRRAKVDNEMVQTLRSPYSSDHSMKSILRNITFWLEY